MTECEKLVEASDKSQTIGEFLEWLSTEKDIMLCKYGLRDDLWPVRDSTESLLADFFGIDMKKVEEERRQILADLRK